MIVIAVGALLLALLLSASTLALIVKAVRGILRLSFGVLVGVGFGIAAAIVAGMIGMDAAVAGCCVGLLACASTLALPVRHQRPDPTFTIRSAPSSKLALPIAEASTLSSAAKPSLVAPALATRLASVTRDIRQAAGEDSLRVDLIDWESVLKRVPELVAETDALFRTASSAEKAVLRAQLTDDLTEIAAEAERRLTTVRRARHAVLRRWVALRIGREGSLG